MAIEIGWSISMPALFSRCFSGSKADPATTAPVVAAKKLKADDAQRVVKFYAQDSMVPTSTDLSVLRPWNGIRSKCSMCTVIYRGGNMWQHFAFEMFHLFLRYPDIYWSYFIHVTKMEAHFNSFCYIFSLGFQDAKRSVPQFGSDKTRGSFHGQELLIVFPA